MVIAKDVFAGVAQKTDDLVIRLVLAAHNWDRGRVVDELFGYIDGAIEMGGNINHCADTGQTALAVAILCDNCELVDFLLDRGADVTTCDGGGVSPLMLGVRYGNVDIVKSLLRAQKVEINHQDNNGYTALMMAASHGNMEMVQCLLKADANIFMTDHQNLLAENLAMNNGHLDVAEVIVRSLENNDLMVAILMDDVQAIERLLNEGFDVNSTGYVGSTPLMLAVEKGDAALVEQLVECGADINAQTDLGRTALMQCSLLASGEIEDYLIKQKADLDCQDKQGKTALMIAIEDRNEALAQRLILEGADVTKEDNQNRAALFFASFYAGEDLFHLLLDHGSSLEDLGQQCKHHRSISKYYNRKQDYVADILIQDGLEKGDIFAISDKLECYSEIRRGLAKNGAFKSEDDVDRFIEISRCKALLAMSYSQDAFGFSRDLTEHLVKEVVLASDDFPAKDQFCDVINVIQDRSQSIRCANGNMMNVVAIPYKHHAAYFIIEYDENQNPIEMTYCDGNSVSFRDQDERGRACTSFAVNMDSVRALSEKGDWLDVFLEDFAFEFDNNFFIGRKGLIGLMKKVAVLDERGMPHISGTSLPIKEQIRGNCCLKSFNIVLREMLSRINPEEMVFEKDGKPGGKGYEIYKEHYKKPLGEGMVDKVVGLVQEAGHDDFSRIDALTFLEKVVYPKAVAKKNERLITLLDEVLVADKVHDMVSVTEASAESVLEKKEEVAQTIR